MNASDFQPWTQYWQNNYHTLRHIMILISNSSAPKTNRYLATIVLLYSAMILVPAMTYLRNVLSALDQGYFHISGVFMGCCWLRIRNHYHHYQNHFNCHALCFVSIERENQTTVFFFFVCFCLLFCLFTSCSSLLTCAPHFMFGIISEINPILQLIS